MPWENAARSENWSTPVPSIYSQEQNSLRINYFFHMIRFYSVTVFSKKKKKAWFLLRPHTQPIWNKNDLKWEANYFNFQGYQVGFVSPNNVGFIFIHLKACILNGTKTGSWKKFLIREWIVAFQSLTLPNKIFFLTINFSH